MAGATLLMSSQPAQANEVWFSCSQYQGIPTTLAKTKRGLVPVIRWDSDYFSESGGAPEAHCQKVSSLFEQYYREGTLAYLTTGRDPKTRQNVICITPAVGLKCTDILFTLKKKSNPGHTLLKLMNLRVRAINYTPNDIPRRVHVSMDKFLDTQPVISSSPSVPANLPHTQ
ncbi:COP23 domain-containing protein (plasmid) [Acaryochloris sp. 'Moss Beach']|uniref:COP23 domain-containing protein n=1 Tax=Acaryochloris sp. 'Moss Beach' TaxID=2740837 RepID=UPI001F2644D7|nr:COP23 domain-containing protein [Acaryochloris sp. 'Moss Beach']UJB73237.1 COP23 domain-containing protein [Acaryochloris sp. 'Moss Beach']